jgi:hypothetical protein
LKAGLSLAAVALVSASAAAGGPSGAHPTAVGFWDSNHGLASFWRCYRCPVRLAATEDGGRTWTTIREAPPNTGIIVAPPDAAWAGRSVTFDQGRSWRTLPRGHYEPLGFADRRVGWGIDPPRAEGADRQRLARTVTGGRRWVAARNPCRRLGEAVVDVASPTRTRAWILCDALYGAGSDAKAVFRTADAGKTWRLVNSVDFHGAGRPIVGHGLSVAGYAAGISMGADGSGWLWEHRGWAYRTSDGGRTWTPWKLAAPEERQVGSVSRVSKRTTFVFRTDYVHEGRGRAYRLLKTIDGGSSWRVVREWVFD